MGGKVDMHDIAMLSAGWQSSYDQSNRVQIAENWLMICED